MVPKQDNFDALRIAAAFCVLVSHQHALAGFPEPGIAGVGSLGGIGVLVFFSISGFLVAQSWYQDPNVLRFAGRRALRIWPALAVVVLPSALVLGPLRSSLTHNEYFRDPGGWKYLRNLRFLLVEGLPGVRFNGSAIPNAINGSMWSIPLEVICSGLTR